MIGFVNDIPEVLNQPQFESVVDELESYFDPTLGVHKQFTDVIDHWISAGIEQVAVSEGEAAGAPGQADTNLEPGGAPGGFPTEQQVTHFSTAGSQIFTAGRLGHTVGAASSGVQNVGGITVGGGSRPQFECKVGQPGTSRQGEVLGAKSKIKLVSTPVSALVDPFKDDLKSYTKVIPSQSKGTFSLETPKQSKVLNDFAAGTHTTAMSQLMTQKDNTFLTTTTHNPPIITQPTHQAQRSMTTQNTRPDEHPLSHQSTTPANPRSHHGDQIDISRVAPRILQLELRTLISSISELENRISALGQHAAELGSANENTNSTLVKYVQDVTKLEERSSKLFER